MSIEQQVRSFILENFLFTDDTSALVDHESLLKRGVVDSTGILEIIAYLEEQFRIKVEDGEMIQENLDSVDRIAAFVTRKKAV
jgi:acyl carrier protein